MENESDEDAKLLNNNGIAVLMANGAGAGYGYVSTVVSRT